jgi:Tfp pilus assembly protein PilN
MKGGLEVIIKSAGFVMTYGRDGINEEVRQDEVDIGEALISFCERHNLRTRTVNLFLAEDLVYMAAIDLPANTPNIGEVVRLQLGMLAPFPAENILHGHSVVRDGSNSRVTITAAESTLVVARVEGLLGAGFVVRGLYPESQRYVTGKWRRLRWALVMPGKLAKIFVFAGGECVERFLSNSGDFEYDELVTLCATDNIFHLNPPAGKRFKAVRMLLAAPPLLKNYNMLPASYRRRDNLKSAILVLLFLNLVGLAALGGLTLVKQTKQINLAEQEISRLQPLVSKVKETKEQIGQTEQFLDSVAKMKGNPDLFAFLANLTLALPAGSYLNQLQFTAATNSVTINGFTDNVGDLTEKLQAVGESRLQSTSRRQNMTYFQVEISLP